MIGDKLQLEPWEHEMMDNAKNAGENGSKKPNIQQFPSLQKIIYRILLLTVVFRILGYSIAWGYFETLP